MHVYNVDRPDLIPLKDQFIVADTNILIGILNGKPSEMKLLNEIKSNSGIVFYTDISMEELYVINDKAHINKRNYSLTQRIGDAQKSISKSQSDMMIITNNGVVYPIPIGIDGNDRLTKYDVVKNQHPLNWADAKILATTIDNGVPLLWTNDCDFGYCNITDIALITNSVAKKNLDKAGASNIYIGF